MHGTIKCTVTHVAVPTRIAGCHVENTRWFSYILHDLQIKLYNKQYGQWIIYSYLHIIASYNN